MKRDVVVQTGKGKTDAVLLQHAATNFQGKFPPIAPSTYSASQVTARAGWYRYRTVETDEERSLVLVVIIIRGAITYRSFEQMGVLDVVSARDRLVTIISLNGPKDSASSQELTRWKLLNVEHFSLVELAAASLLVSAWWLDFQCGAVRRNLNLRPERYPLNQWRRERSEERSGGRTRTGAGTGERAGLRIQRSERKMSKVLCLDLIIVCVVIDNKVIICTWGLPAVLAVVRQYQLCGLKCLMVKQEPGGTYRQRRTCGHYASSALPLRWATQNPIPTPCHSSLPATWIRSNLAIKQEKLRWCGPQQCWEYRKEWY